MFQTGKIQQDRAYHEMLVPIRNRIQNENRNNLASRAGGRMSENGDEIILETFGQQVAVHLPDCEIRPALESWHALVLLHYLVNADGTALAGRWISFEDMKDGLIRGTKFARSSSQWFLRFLKGKKMEEVEEACAALGGEKTEGKGDLNMRIPFLPNFPLLVSFWEADEEFDATGKILLDGSADHYLSIEDAVTVGEILQKCISLHFPI